jgi:predicted NAD/FAD-dependent oxidoreductase
MENDLDSLKSELISELSQIIGFDANKAIHANIHRWRYANISKQSGDKSLVDKINKLATCGDWLIQGRIESAFASAMNLVEKMKPILL